MSGIDAYTKLMLHMDGVVDSDDFVDSSLTPKTITVSGPAYIKEDIGYSEYRPDGSGFEQAGEFLRWPNDSYLSIEASEDWQLFGSSERSDTVDFFYKLNADNEWTDTFYIGICDCENFFIEFFFTIGTDPSYGSMQFQLTSYDSDGNSVFTIQATYYQFFPVGVWTHIQFVRSGDIGYIFLNGRRVPTEYLYVITGTHEQLLDSLDVGGISRWSETVCGRIDEFRISKGVARNITNFTPPVIPYDTLNDYGIVGTIQLNPTLICNLGCPEFIGNISVNSAYTGICNLWKVKKQSLINSDELISKGFLRDQSIFNDISLNTLIDTNGLDYYKQGVIFTVIYKSCIESILSVINSLRKLTTVEINLNNSLSFLCSLEFQFENSLLPYNEVEKDFVFCNRLFLTNSESYNGFYFLKVHGV